MISTYVDVSDKDKGNFEKKCLLKILKSIKIHKVCWTLQGEPLPVIHGVITFTYKVTYRGPTTPQQQPWICSCQDPLGLDDLD